MAVIHRHTGPVVVDEQHDAILPGAHLEPGGTGPVLVGVVEKVDHDPLQAPLVTDHGHPLDGRIDHETHLPSTRGQDAPDELGNGDLASLLVGRARVVTRDLQEVRHQPLEAVHLRGHQLERNL